MKGKRLLCLFTICCVLLAPFHGVAAEDTSWVEARNRARYRGTAISEAERAYYTKVTTCAAKTVRTLAEEITAGLPDDAARLRAIYDWVRENIAYDSAHKPHTICSCTAPDLPDDALKQKKSHAGGMASLASQLCRAVGIPAQLVGGYRLEPGESWGTKHRVMTYGGDGNHQWNEAYVDGHWAIFDTVTGLFDTSADTFFQTHLKLGNISDGTYLYFQRFRHGDGTVSLAAPLDKGITVAEVPEQVVGLTVSGLESNAFEGCAALSDIRLPATVTKVGNYAFAGTAIEEVPDLSAVKEPASGLFAGCTSLETVDFPAHWTVVEGYMFQECTSLNEVTLPDGVQYINPFAFAACTALEEVTLPAKLCGIGNGAFMRSGITAAHLPASVTAVGNFAFSGCQNLKEVTLPAGLTTIPREAFRGCIALAELALPEGVTTIEESAFEGCTALAALALPEGLETVGEAAFKGCVALTELVLPEGLVSLGKEAFSGCSRITKLTLPSTFTTIGHRALTGLTALQEVQVAEGNETYFAEDGVLFAASPRTLLLYPPARPNTSYTIPASVKKVAGAAFAGVTQLETVRVDATILLHEGWDGGDTFRDCTGLRRIDFAPGTRVVPEGGFVGCTSLTEVNLPSSLITLNLWDFTGCTALERITLPASVRTFYGVGKERVPALQGVYVNENNKALGDTDGVVFQKKDNRLLWYPPARPATTYQVPAHITAIGAEAFKSADALTSILLPEGLKEIDYDAFRGTSLTAIDLPKSLTYIRNTALCDTPWWDAQQPGPVYCGDVFCGIKGTFLEKELAIQEGTRLTACGGWVAAEELKRLIIPASVTAIRMEDSLPESLVSIVGQRGSAAENFAKWHNRHFADPAEMFLGDADGDLAVTTTDARLTLQYAVKKADEYDLFLDMADVDGDGEYTTTDARLMLQYAVGKIEDFPI